MSNEIPTPIDVIRKNAELHKEKYSRFDLQGFLVWVQNKPLQWQVWASPLKIPYLTAIKRAEQWAARTTNRNPQYTAEPREV